MEEEERREGGIPPNSSVFSSNLNTYIQGRKIKKITLEFLK